MFNKVSRYQTVDGKLHESKEKAREHIANQCRATLDSYLKQLLGHYTQNDLYRIVMALAPDAMTAQALANDLAKHFTGDCEGYED